MKTKNKLSKEEFNKRKIKSIIKWRKNNIEKFREYRRIYYKTHKNYCREAVKKHYKKMKDLYGLGIGTMVRYGFKLALNIYEKFNRKCANCYSENDLTIHHIDRVGRNYLENKLNMNNDIDNLILLCRKCHGSIHGKQGGRPKKC